MTPPGIGRADGGFIAVVPPNGIGGGSQAHQFGDRGRHQERAGVQLEEAFVAIERLHDDAPGGSLHAGRRRRRDDVLSELLEWIEGGGRPRAGLCAAGRSGKVKQDATSVTQARAFGLRIYFKASTALIASSKASNPASLPRLVRRPAPKTSVPRART